MGTFDYVNFEMDCPCCGRKVSDFQSRNGECIMDTVDPSEISHFYAPCVCGNWIELKRLYPADKNPRSAPYSLKDVKKLGFVITRGGMLEPCPFCGQDVELNDEDDFFSVKCNTLGCIARPLNRQGFPEKNTLISAWNRRAKV